MEEVAAKGRCLSPAPNFSDTAQGSQLNGTVPPVFLSYSRAQKGFVWKLYDALVRAGHWASAFFDKVSLPGGVLISEIERSARECKLGVVVLSKEYLTTRWPMLELELMTADSNIIILPLFYQLSPEDLKNEQNISDWREEWVKLDSIDVGKWKNAVESIPDRIGQVFRSDRMGEDQYIEDIVNAICKIIPPTTRYDLSYAKGRERLVEEIETRFNHAELVSKFPSGACAIGLHGIGGIGKTTLSKMMVNFYMQKYAGRSELIEFPSEINMDSVLLGCKKVLQCFTTLDKSVLEGIGCFDQAVQRMKEQMKLRKVFMVIDNIWEHSLKEAKRILEVVKVGFAPGSKVLLTSRSDAVLKELLNVCDKKCEKCVGCVPCVNQKEALETLEAFIGKDLSSVPQGLLVRIVDLCLFNGSYHPLALEAMGRRLGRMKGWGDDQTMHKKLFSITFSSQLLRIEEVIKGNFEGIPSIRQRMFLDVAFTFPKSFGYLPLLEETCALLRILYEEECSSHEDIDYHLELLAFDGLVRFEDDMAFDGPVRFEDDIAFDGPVRFEDDKKVVVHDLYLELAQREAASSSRFLLLGQPVNIKVERAKVERVLQDGPHVQQVCLNVLQDCPIVELLSFGRSRCSNVELLSVGLSYPEGPVFESMRSLRVLRIWGDIPNVRLETMSSLRVLKISSGQIGNVTGLSAAQRLEVLEITECKWTEEPWGIADVATLTKLQTLIIESAFSSRFNGADVRLDLRGCHLLKTVRLIGFGLLVGDCLKLRNLGSLWISQLRSLKRLPNMRSLAQLEVLNIHYCDSLEEIGEFPFNLRSINLDGLRSLKRVHDMRSLTQLENLEIEYCDSVEEIGEFPCNLRRINLSTLPRLKRLPNMRSLAKLQELHMRCFESLEEIVAFPSNLQNFTICFSPSLRRVPDMRSLAQLEELDIHNCESLEEIGEFSSNLQNLSLSGLRSLKEIGEFPSNLRKITLRLLRLKRFPAMRSLAQLKNLMIYDCEFLEGFGEFPTNVRSIDLWELPSLNRIPDVSSLAELHILLIRCCEFLEEIGEFPSHLEHICLNRLRSLKRVPDISSLAELRSLKIRYCDSLEEIGEFPSHLKSIILHRLPTLKRVLDMRSLADLKKLSILNCESLEEIGEFPTTLLSINLYSLPSLNRVPDMLSLGEYKFNYTEGYYDYLDDYCFEMIDWESD